MKMYAKKNVCKNPEQNNKQNMTRIYILNALFIEKVW